MWKQIGGTAAIILSVVMLLISIACFILLLVYRQPVIETTSTLLDQADVALNVAVESADVAVTLSGEVQALVDETQTRLNEAVDEVEERKQEVVTDVQGVVAGRFGAQIRTTVATAQAVADTMSAAYDLAVSISRIPGVNVAPPGIVATEEITRQAQAIEETATQVSENVARITTLPGEAVDAANASLSELSRTVAEIEASLSEMNAQVAATQETVQTLQESHVRIINLTVTILCIILAWTIFSQVIVMRWAWKLMQEPATA